MFTLIILDVVLNVLFSALVVNEFIDQDNDKPCQ